MLIFNSSIRALTHSLEPRRSVADHSCGGGSDRIAVPRERTPGYRVSRSRAYPRWVGSSRRRTRRERCDRQKCLSIKKTNNSSYWHNIYRFYRSRVYPPRMSHRTNVVPPLRWSARAVLQEFEVSQSLLNARLDDVEERPGEDNCYSTKQIVNALFGTLRDARLKKLKLESERLELENAELRGEMLPKSELMRVFSELSAVMLEIIKSSKLSAQERVDLREALANIEIRVEDAAKVQARGQNGQSANGAPKKRGRPPKPKPDEKAAV